MTPGVRILDPGLHATIQDMGRIGHQAAGVAVCGALDHVALHLANRLVGNAPATGAFECLYRGLTLQAEADSVVLATAGGEADISITQPSGQVQHLPTHRSFHLSRGDILRIGNIRSTSCLYIAVAGGLDVTPVLGSVSTDTRARLGG